MDVKAEPLKMTLPMASQLCQYTVTASDEVDNGHGVTAEPVYSDS